MIKKNIETGEVNQQLSWGLTSQPDWFFRVPVTYATGPVVGYLATG